MNSEKRMRRHLSPLGAWAFSIGTSVGWGSLVVTANTYLAQAGPVGSVLGLVLGAAVMLVISRSYAYLMRCFPDCGGAYAYARDVFGYDQGFVAAWFLSMTYFAILWANATSLPLFSRIFLGGIFRFGRLYSLFGYDVYLGEALLSSAALALIGLLCMRRKRWIDGMMIALALLFSAGIFVCFLGSVLPGRASSPGQASPLPLFLPDIPTLSQIVKIAVISPWAFIGFESISHATEEFDFDRRRTHRILLVSVVSTLLLYVFVTLASVAVYPPQYDSWLSYIRDLDHLSGLEALPAFYAAHTCLGSFGVAALTLSLLALVITSLIGNMSALSRLVFSLARDGVLPERFARLNERGVPADAVGLVVLSSVLVPLVGRTAIGWIVDVTTIGATLIYTLVSLAAAKLAGEMGDKPELWAGRIGAVVLLVFGAVLLLPNLIARGTMARETYLLFIIWSVLGFLSFRSILHRDRGKRFGNSIVVWTALLALVLFASVVWMRQSMIASHDRMLGNVRSFFSGTEVPEDTVFADKHYIEEQMELLQAEDTRTMLMAVGMFTFALFIMLTNHSFLNKRSQESEKLANIDPLTGVKSKHAYLVKEQELDKAIGNGTVRKLAVVVCDVNGLKKVNDTYGHKAGDEYIREACRMVCEIFQHSPVFRVGGDEFTVILTDRDYTIRKELMVALHERSAAHITTGGAVVSGGLSGFRPAEDERLRDLFQRADERMYQEKKLLKSLGAVTRDDAEEEAPEQALLPESHQAILKVRRHLLIVDDESINRSLLADALRGGYELIFASDGYEALEQVREHRDELALILLDLIMPHMGGMEVLKALKNDEELKDIPVIILTSDQNAELNCLNLGAMDFIPKPYPRWEIIRARVNKCIELSEDRDIIRSTERDSLTRLFNIDYFLRYVKKFDQHYWDMPMDAVVLDVTHFHMLNERYGKQYGDAILRRIGERVRTLARSLSGVGCRQGADTFLIYCPHQEDYGPILEELSADLAGDDASSSRVRLRLGVYSQVDKNLEIEQRFDRAKCAADSVKTGHLQAVGIYDTQLHEQALFRERLLEDFRTSLAEHRFVVCYQPKFDIRPDVPLLASAEALVRWSHPELGMLKPRTFIPLLEENGLILELDTFVWRETAKQIRLWKQQHGFSVPVSVNVSRIDMLTPNLKELFQQILDENGLSTADLMLEITESAYTGDAEQVLTAARELRGMGMGFRIEMDDFGSGYSSLGMLSHLPIDALKLDISFIRSAFGEKRDVRMIELIIDIADYLHVPVVAEGVETEEQYLTLKAMGCDLVQGYYFSRPVPAPEFDHFLSERGAQSMKVTNAFRKSCLSLSKALTNNFEDIFYVDLVTDYYLEFYTSPQGELQIRPGGTDFFRDARESILRDVPEPERATLSAALEKENLRSWLGREETVPFVRSRAGATTRYCLQTVRTRSSDDHHIVIAVRPD